jgi:F0F1-type ATP synthase assembly protein I
MSYWGRRQAIATENQNRLIKKQMRQAAAPMEPKKPKTSAQQAMDGKIAVLLITAGVVAIGVWVLVGLLVNAEQGFWPAFVAFFVVLLWMGFRTEVFKKATIAANRGRRGKQQQPSRRSAIVEGQASSVKSIERCLVHDYAHDYVCWVRGEDVIIAGNDTPFLTLEAVIDRLASASYVAREGDFV